MKTRETLSSRLQVGAPELEGRLSLEVVYHDRAYSQADAEALTTGMREAWTLLDEPP